MIILELIALAWLGNLLTWKINISKYLNFEVFKCTLCFSFWIGLIYFMIFYKFNIMIIIYALIVSLLSAYMEKHLNLILD